MIQKANSKTTARNPGKAQSLYQIKGFPYAILRADPPFMPRRLLQANGNTPDTEAMLIRIGDSNEVIKLQKMFLFNKSHLCINVESDSTRCAQSIFKLNAGLFPISGEWAFGLRRAACVPQNFPKATSTLPDTGSNERHGEMQYAIRIPAKYSYEIPTLIRFGGRNASPHPLEHSTVLKYWYQKYGIEVTSINADTIECTVSSPPDNYPDAKSLAVEQLAYCNTLSRYHDTLEAMAQHLTQAKRWKFWWD